MNAVAIRRLRLAPYWWAGGILLALAILIGSLATSAALTLERRWFGRGEPLTLEWRPAPA